MISVEEAKALIAKHVSRNKGVLTGLADAAGCVLAKAVFAPVDLPLFNQSAMDGYALHEESLDKKNFRIAGELKAGDETIQLEKGEAARIYTGAAVPEKAGAVVMQEKTTVSNSLLELDELAAAGNFIRYKGSQVKKGELALCEGAMLTPAAIGFLASMGIAEVLIHPKPVVSVIVTGNELLPPASVLSPGKIYESNSFTLRALLQQINIPVYKTLHVKDDPAVLRDVFMNYCNESDVIIFTGGISVGEYDFVKAVLEQSGVQTIFHNVAQKPGKPLYFGMLDNKPVFALPGNPASTLVCFYEYVYMAIRLMQGFENPGLLVEKKKLLKSLKKSKGKAFFIHAKKMEEGIMPLGKQGSDMLHTFASADALIFLDEACEFKTEGEEVEVHLLPN